MDHFEVLGIRHGASEGEIRTAFLALAKLHHPDRGGDEKRFVRLEFARTAAIADAKKISLTRTQTPRGTDKHHEPEEYCGPVTVFHVGPSPFELPRQNLSDTVSFFSARF